MNDWDFADSERAHIERWAQLSYAQRLRWLWEAKMFAQRAVEAARLRSLEDLAIARREISRMTITTISEGDPRRQCREGCRAGVATPQAT